jgi:hypothetical protein
MMVVTGKIQGDGVKLKSNFLGELNIESTDCRQMTGNQGRVVLMVDAAANVSGNEWFETGVNVEKGQRLIILASGSVDLWPQGLGQYLTTPKGLNTAGKGGVFMAGLGRQDRREGPERLYRQRFHAGQPRRRGDSLSVDS